MIKVTKASSLLLIRKSEAGLRILFLSTLSVVGTLVWASNAGAADASPLLPVQLIEKITMPNIVGRIDHLTADTKRKRLFISAVGNDSVEVVDVFKGRHIHSITGVNGPKGIVWVADFNKLYVVSAGDGVVKVYDESFLLLKTIQIGLDVDFIRYEPNLKKIFVSYSDKTGGIMEIDPATDTPSEMIYKTGDPVEDFAVEKSGARIFANVPDASHDGNTVEVIDGNTHAVTAKWVIPGIFKNIPMALNEDDHRLYIVTRKPARLVVLDTESGKEVARLPAARDCADICFDAKRKWIYVMGGEGILNVFKVNNPDSYELLANIPTELEARTGFFYAKRDLLYIPVPDTGDTPAHVLNYEPNK